MDPVIEKNTESDIIVENFLKTAKEMAKTEDERKITLLTICIKMKEKYPEHFI